MSSLRRQVRCMTLFVVFAVLSDAAEPQPPASNQTLVGAAKLDITPDYPMRLSGYGNRRTETEVVAQRIWAKAIAIGEDEGQGPAVWICFENCGLTPAIREAVAEQLKAEKGIRSDRLVISVTHSHTAPCLTNWAPFLFGPPMPPEHQAHVDQYTQELTEKLVRVALNALNSRREAALFWARGRLGFAANRRLLQDGKWAGFGVQADGPVDHDLPILVAKDREGKVAACVANYACHCTTLGGDFNQIAGDWAGYAQEFLEAENPGSVAMIAIGCGADANPEPRSDDLELCRQHGRALASEFQRLVQSELKPLEAEIRCRETTIDLPFNAARGRDEWSERVKLGGPPAEHAKYFLGMIERGEKIPEEVPYKLATWSFGKDLAMVFLAGEVVVDYSIRLKTEFDSERLWINAYSNDVPCYIPSKRILNEGGYEADSSLVYYGRPQSFAPEVEDLIVDAVQKLLPHEFYSAAKQADFPPPKSADESLKALTVLPGWKVELVAAEPLVQDPVAFDWAPDGRLWVAEMADYPNGMAWDKPGDPLGVAGGRIKLLRDTDGDGRYDSSSLFLDKVPFPNGVKAWRNGVLVTAAPIIFYAEDTDGDGVADRQETLFEGFAPGNQQHRANGLRWGVDNWLYVANGDSGGKVKSLKTGEEISISGRDLRIRPDEGALEAQSGQTQFGRCRDDWGNWFGGNNANPLWHYVLDDHYLRRNPHYSPPAVRRDVPEFAGAAPVFPTSRTLARFNDFHTANRFTSACSPEIYRDEVLASALGQGTHVLICEPVHNLVHHEVMQQEGISFHSRRPDSESKSEFFASSDNWCRPVMVRTGPDGAVWIADMYRQVIEHPEWIPVSWQRKLELRAGSDRGRIYRVTVDRESQSDFPRLDQLSTSDLVKRLNSPNGWQRDMAQQMLIWKRDAAVVEELEAFASQATRATGRLHALGTLDALGLLRSETISQAIGDSHPGVRRHAVRLSERFLGGDSELLKTVIALAEDSDPLVRQQVAYSLGEVTDNPDESDMVKLAGQALGRIALRDGEDPILAAAVHSSVKHDNASSLLQEVLRAEQPPQQFIQSLMTIVTQWQQQDTARQLILYVLKQATADSQEPAAARFNSVAHLLESLSRNRSTAARLMDERARQELEPLAKQARQLVADEEANVGDRVAAIRLIGSLPRAEPQDAELLTRLLAPRNPPELQVAVVDAVFRSFPEIAGKNLLAGWRSHSPAVRANILDAMFTRPAYLNEFLGAVARGEIATAHVDARRKTQLTNHADAAIRDRARQIFKDQPETDRRAVVAEHLTVASLAGDRARGKAIFTKKCSVCHRLEEAGQNVGPDLTALTDKSPQSMLVAILDPNKAVEDKFLDFIAVTDDGRQFTGMIADETTTTVALINQEGKAITLRRNELEALQTSGKSLMPEGLEKELSRQDLADVIAYVRSVSIPPKKFPGNEPGGMVEVRDDGSIRLPAMHARIYGPSLVFEEKHRNLGYWQNADDYATWTIDVPMAGKYRVSIEYACPADAAGDRFVVAVGDQTIGGTTESTGSWDDYRSRPVGSIQLSEGSNEILVRSDGPIHSALFDLRQILLHPN